MILIRTGGHVSVQHFSGKTDGFWPWDFRWEGWILRQYWNAHIFKAPASLLPAGGEWHTYERERDDKNGMLLVNMVHSG